MDICNKSSEPMDVDLSTNSGNLSAMDISDTSDPVEEKVNNIRTGAPDPKNSWPPNSSPSTKKHKYRILNIKMKTAKKTNSLKLKVIISMIHCVLISLLIYNVMNFKCSGELDVNSIIKTLNKKLHGQQDAVKDITKALKSNDKSKIIFLYGGTGVGKTLTVSLIFESLWHHSNVYHHVMPSFATSFSTDFLLGLALCDKSYFIVDNLNQIDITVNSFVRDVIAKSEDLGKHITVILVFNCDYTSNGLVIKCNQSFESRLKDSFSEMKAAKYFVHYEPLLESHLQMCIKNELGDKVVSDLDMNRFIKYFDVSLDGCKGVHMKMKLLNAELFGM